jgi:hypothetical protein
VYNGTVTHHELPRKHKEECPQTEWGLEGEEG